jgi:cytochrome c-type biogenesis protein CcmH/NrfG
MKAESIGYVLAGMLFGIILGWVLATQQQGASSVPVVPATGTAAAPPAQQTARQPPPLDEARVQALTKAVESDPSNVGATTELANLYFAAERFGDAVQWFERSLKLQPNDADVSTELALSYFYTERIDQSLTQFDYSLKLNPAHVRTLLQKGVVLAFGKEDIKGATAAWQRVIELAPNTPEAQAARRALEGIAAGPHPGGGTPAPTNQ